LAVAKGKAFATVQTLKKQKAGTMPGQFLTEAGEGNRAKPRIALAKNHVYWYEYGTQIQVDHDGTRQTNQKREYDCYRMLGGMCHFLRVGDS
jgi:hypothetical protein